MLKVFLIACAGVDAGLKPRIRCKFNDSPIMTWCGRSSTTCSTTFWTTDRYRPMSSFSHPETLWSESTNRSQPSSSRRCWLLVRSHLRFHRYVIQRDDFIFIQQSCHKLQLPFVRFRCKTFLSAFLKSILVRRQGRHFLPSQTTDSGRCIVQIQGSSAIESGHGQACRAVYCLSTWAIIEFSLVQI